MFETVLSETVFGLFPIERGCFGPKTGCSKTPFSTRKVLWKSLCGSLFPSFPGNEALGVHNGTVWMGGRKVYVFGQEWSDHVMDASCWLCDGFRQTLLCTICALAILEEDFAGSEKLGLFCGTPKRTFLQQALCYLKPSTEPSCRTLWRRRGEPRPVFLGPASFPPKSN